MVYDDIIIGSGLSALGTALGLPAKRRVLVLAGYPQALSQYYDSSRAVPCAHLGLGGLGNFWHGVIPTGAQKLGSDATESDFIRLFKHFYARDDVASRIGQPFLFVPLRPIRPKAEWPRIAAQPDRRLELLQEPADRFSIDGSSVTVWAKSGRIMGKRLWICSGALHTPGLLDRSLGRKVSRDYVSDHVLCYLGQVDRSRYRHVAPPTVERSAGGMWLGVESDITGNGLVTFRPARFGYRVLDYGIEQRAAFGLPTGNAIAKIVRASSLGLIAEALYNRFGLFPNARFQSVYVQLVVRDAHRLQDGDIPLQMRVDAIRGATDAARAHFMRPELTPSRHPEIFIPMIHLHGSVDDELLRDSGVNVEGAAVQVVDASVYPNIGPEHHSFRLMVSAYAKARSSS